MVCAPLSPSLSFITHPQHSLALKAAACIVNRGKLLTVPLGGEGESIAVDDREEDGGAAGADGAAGASASAAAAADPLSGTIDVAFSSLEAFMRLDASAVRALDLLPQRREAALPVNAASAGASSASAGAGSSSSPSIAPGSVTSLLGLLTHHASKGGARMLRQWMLQPLSSVEGVRARADMLTAFVESPTLRRGWKAAMPKADYSALAGRLQRKTASLADLVRFRQQVASLDGVIAILNDYDGPAERGADLATYAHALQVSLDELGAFVELFNENVDDGGREPRIREDRDPALEELGEAARAARGALADLHAQCKDEWDDIGDDLKYEWDRTKGHVFRVSKRHEKAVRALKGVATITNVLKDGIYFSTKALTQAGEVLADAEAEYAEASRALIAELLDAAREFTALLEASATVLSELDAYASMAAMVAGMSGTWVRPVLTPAGAGDIIIMGGRHPVMEMNLEDGKPFIPNDYIMKREAGRLQIITGPNS